MDAFQLDTSGAVETDPRGAPQVAFRRWFWSDLSPFEQGYVEAVFASLGPPFHKAPGIHTGERPCRFSDLAPETLAAILEDCGRNREACAAIGLTEGGAESGAEFWRARNICKLHHFPPLTPYLDDAGKVRLREASNG